MRREEFEDRGYVPDYIITQAALKKKLGITERRMIRGISVHGIMLTIDLGIYGHRRIEYHLPAEEFKGKLGIEKWESVLMVLASVWNDKIMISLSGTHPEESVRIR